MTDVSQQDGRDYQRVFLLALVTAIALGFLILIVDFLPAIILAAIFLISMGTYRKVFL